MVSKKVANLRTSAVLTWRDKRRKLGINKSTLWYMQKHIKEGKKIKVYNKVKDKVRWNGLAR